MNKIETELEKGTDRNRALRWLSLVMLTSHAVVVPSWHTALLEIYGRSRMDRDIPAQFLEELLFAMDDAETRASL